MSKDKEAFRLRPVTTYGRTATLSKNYSAGKSYEFRIKKEKKEGRVQGQHFLLDRESLYSETLVLKNSLNALQEVNRQLKVKVLNLSREAQKYEKMVQQHSQPDLPDKKKDLPAQLAAYRNQLKDKIAELADKDRQLSELKKNAKFTKMYEMEVELQMYTKECTRLRQQLEQLQIKQRPKEKEGETEELRDENIELA